MASASLSDETIPKDLAPLVIEQEELLTHMSRYLESQHNEVFRTRPRARKAKFRAWNAKPKPAFTSQTAEEMLDLVFRTPIHISANAKMNFTGYLNSQLMAIEKRFRSMAEVNGRFRLFLLRASQSMIRTAGLLTLPQLPPPQPIMFVRNLRRYSRKCKLSISLWSLILSFLEPVPSKSWWESASYPIFLLRQTSSICCRILAPPSSNPVQFFGNDVITELYFNDLDLKQSPEHFTPDACQAIAEAVFGLPKGCLRGHHQSDMRLVMQSIGVRLRLQHHIPTLLVGEFSVDVCEMVSTMLQSQKQAIYAELTASLDLLALEERLAQSQLLVILCDEACMSTKEIALLEDILMGRTCLKIVLGVLPCRRPSVHTLQSVLPVHLREAVVFY